MTYYYRLRKTLQLEDILRNYGGNTHNLITQLYDNGTLLSNDTLYENLVEQTSYERTDFEFKSPIDEQETYHNFYLRHLELVQSELPKDMVWSNNRRRTTRFNDSHLIEQIRTRYAFFNRPTTGLSNIIIDNYAPKLMYTSRFSQQEVMRTGNLPKTIYTISPWFAQYFGAHQVPTEQLCRILGYDLKTLKSLVTKVKRNNYSISFVGYGGTNVNTIHWLTEIMKITQSVNLFNFIEVYEPDTIEISNLLRFPKNPYIERSIYSEWGVSSTSKLRLLDPAELSLLSRSKANIQPRRIDGQNLSHTSKGVRRNYETRRYEPKDNHIFYGAPNIDTRASFEGVGHFISATHNGNDAHLWLNPTQDADLQVESYGLIELTPFFMNQLRLAIGLLETLARERLDLKQPDDLLLSYSFDGIPKLSTNRTYNFQIAGHSGLVATEEEAANAW